MSLEDIKKIYPAVAKYSLNWHGDYEACNSQGEPLAIDDNGYLIPMLQAACFVMI